MSEAPEIPQPAVDPVPPPACPICFLTPSEQGEMMRAKEPTLQQARCVLGACVVLGIAYMVDGQGAPMHPLYAWWDNPGERHK